jgi:hypothetical protein
MRKEAEEQQQQQQQQQRLASWDFVSRPSRVNLILSWLLTIFSIFFIYFYTLISTHASQNQLATSTRTPTLHHFSNK